SVTFLAHQAVVMVDAIGRTLWRVCVSRRSLLEWQTAADTEQRMGTTLRGFWARMWSAPALAAILLGLVWLLRPETLPVALPFAFVWALSPVIAWWVSLPIRDPAPAVTEPEREMLRVLARKTWRF